VVRAWYDRLVTTLAVMAVSVMLAAALIGTVSRYLVFLPSISWGEEVTRFGGIWAVFLVAGLSIRRGAHLGVDVLAARFPPGVRRVTRLLGALLILAFSTLLLVYGLRLALENRTQYSPALEWSMGAVYLCIPIGAALMIVESLGLVRRLVRGDPPPASAATSRIE
jgi:TRAP-type C4-dicarboxylate transport system permease small subunit